MNAAIAAYLPAVTEFLAARARRGRSLETRSEDIRAAFNAWLEERGAPPISARRLAVLMRSQGFRPLKRSVMFWCGLALND
jgi:hypothetical protein